MKLIDTYKKTGFDNRSFCVLKVPIKLFESVVSNIENADPVNLQDSK